MERASQAPALGCVCLSFDLTGHGRKKEAQEWYKSHGDVFTEIERETVAVESLNMLARIYDSQGNKAEADKYRKAYTAAVAADPDRYNEVRSSPCYALYKANPQNKDNQARKQ